MTSTKHHLHPELPCVVHKSKRRTRLRVPKKFRNSDTLHPVKDAINEIPGVRHVEVNPETGSILVHHDDHPGILAAISAALAETAPQLLVSLVVPETLPEVGTSLISNVARRLLEPGAKPENEGSHSDGSEHRSFGEAMPAIKRAVPMAFLVAGVVKLVQSESIWAGMAPLALFYYAFDSYWKFDQQERIEELERVRARRNGSSTSITRHHPD